MPFPKSHLECVMCGELLAGHDGKGRCYDLGDGLRVCETCYTATTDLLVILMPLPTSAYGGDDDLLARLEAAHQEKREETLKHLIVVLMRTGHKARVRVQQHEARMPHSSGGWEGGLP